MPNSKISPPVPALVAEVIDRYPAPIRDMLLALRTTILDVAASEDTGVIEETLKWGQPSYLTKTGTTIRIDRDATHGGDVALYVNCKTTLVDEWRERFPDFSFGGTRSLHLGLNADLDDDRLKMCIADALTYHRRGRKRAAAPG